MVVNEYFVLNPTQSEVFSHQYNDVSCSGTNTVSPLKPSDIIVGFYDNSVKLKLTITWIDGQDIKLDSSKGVFSASYKVTVSEVSSSTTANISADSSNSVLIKD
ncbi:fimbrial protein, partial [Escherichia coli]